MALKCSLHASLLIGILIVSAWIRFRIAPFGLPELLQSDEKFFMFDIDSLAQKGTLSEGSVPYAAVWLHLLAGIERVFIAFPSWCGLFPFSSASDITAYIGRYLVSFLGVLLVFATYVIAKEFTGRRETGLIASVIAAVHPLTTLQSVTLKPDTPTALLTLAGLYGILKISQYPHKYGGYFISGMAIGLGASLKYLPFLLFVPYAFAWGVHFRQRREVGASNFRAGIYLALFVFALANYELILNPHLFISSLQWIVVMSKPAQGWEFSYLEYGEGFWSQWGTGALLIGLLGVQRLLITRRNEASILVIFSVVHVLFIGMFSWYGENRLLALIPVFGIFFGAGVLALGRYGESRWTRAPVWIPIVLVSVLLIVKAAETVRVSNSMLLPNTRVLSKVWIDANLPPGVRIGREMYAPRPDTSKFLVENLGVLGALKAVPDQFDYIVTSSGDYDRVYQDPERHPGEVAGYEELFRKFPTLKEFVADKQTSSGPVIRILKTRPEPLAGTQK